LKHKWQIISILVIATVLGGTGQFLFKYGFNNPNSLALFIILGGILYAISTGIYFYALSRTHLGWAYGLTGISYIVATIFAAFILKENVTLIRWTGVFTIAFGVVLISISPHNYSNPIK